MHQVPQWIYITFTAVTAAGVLLQAFVLLGMLLALKGALGRLNEVSRIAEQDVLPTLASARKVLEEIGPKLKFAAQNAAIVSEHAVKISAYAAEISEKAKEKSDAVGETVDHLLQKTEFQADRVDEMVTGTLNSIAHATATLQRAVAGPVRQISAVLNGVRAGIDVLRSREPEAHAAADGEHFV